MRPFIHTCLSILLIALSASAEIDTIWTRTIPDFNGNTFEFTGACGLADNGFALCGFVAGPDSYQDILVARVDGLGNLLWMNEYGGIFTQDPWAILEADDGTLRVFASEYTDAYPYIVTKILALRADGDSLWTQSYFEIEEFGKHAAAKTSDGGFVMVADTMVMADTMSTGNQDVWMMKVNAAGVPLWTRTYELGGWAYGRRVIETSDGSLVITGEFFPADSTWQSYAFLIHTNSNGILTWNENYPLPVNIGPGGWGGSQITGLAENISGDFFVAGSANIQWWNTAFLMKFNSAGEHLWSNDPAEWAGYSYAGVAPELDGGCSVVGTVYSMEVGTINPLIQEYDAQGAAGESWQPNLTYFGLLGVCPAANGGSLAFGYSIDNFSEIRGGYLVRMGPPTIVTGQVTAIGNNQPMQGVRVALSADNAFDLTDSNGGYMIVTTATQTNILLTGPCIESAILENQTLNEGVNNVRNFSVGVPEYSRMPSSVNLAIRYDIEQTFTVTLANSGSGDLTFNATAVPQAPTYNWLSVSPHDGTLAPGESRDLTLSILADSEHGTDIDFFGTIRVRNHSCPDSVDNIPVSAIAMDADEQPGGLLRDFALHSAYPNPFNAVTQLRFDLPSPGQVRLDLFDISGRLVRTLVGEQMTAGSHSISIDMANASSGVYLVRMNAGGFTATRKIVLIK